MTLHPQAAAAIALWSRGPAVTDPGFGAREIDERRRLAVEEAAAEPKEPVDHVEMLEAGGVPCRLYRPRGATGVIVFLHGGGFVFGDIESYDAQSRRIANRTGFAVLAIDYRRPPEHRFPAAPDDVDTVTGWLRADGTGIGLDVTRLVALGDSAGGNLALVAALRNRAAFAATVLVYPFIDPRMRFPSYGDTSGALKPEEAAWCWQQYAATADDFGNPDLGPIDSAALGSLPPTLVIAAEHDILLDENRELARRIEKAGGTVQEVTHPGMVHGFWRHPTLFDAAERSLSETAAFLRRHVP